MVKEPLIFQSSEYEKIIIDIGFIFVENVSKPILHLQIAE